VVALILLPHSATPTAEGVNRHVRLVVFTGDAALETQPWWRVVLEMPGVTHVLVCRRVLPRGPGAVWKRFRRNVKKHGLLFVPYRATLLAGSVIRRLFVRASTQVTPAPGAVEVEEHVTPNIHAPATLAFVGSWGADLGVSLGAPILRPELFTLPRRGTINMHLGKVPEFRGAPPGFWELHVGATSVGATVHWVDEGLDTGPLLATGEASIYPHDTLERVQRRVAELGVRVLRNALSALARGADPRFPQPQGGRTFRQPTLVQQRRLGLRLFGRLLVRRMGSPRYLVKTVVNLLALFLARPLRDLARSARARHPVRVFTFHRVSELSRDGMTVPEVVFRRQIRYIARHHRVVGMDEGLRLALARPALRRPVAVITFDDAYRSVLERAYPVLAAAGLPACCFVTTGLVGTDRRFAHDDENPARAFLDVMNWDELRTLRNAGWSFGGHTTNHPRLSTCAPDVVAQEIDAPLHALARELGAKDIPMSYPFGGPEDITPAAMAVIRGSGYAACFSNHGGENRGATDPFDLARIDLGGDHDTVGWKVMAHGVSLGAMRSAWTSVMGLSPGERR